jgi:hypothetical protein
MVSPAGLGMTLLIGGEVGRPTWPELHEMLIGPCYFLDADPTRQSEGREYSRRERDSSKSRGEENGFERRRRDRSPPDDDTRKWRTTDSSHVLSVVIARNLMTERKSDADAKPLQSAPILMPGTVAALPVSVVRPRRMSEPRRVGERRNEIERRKRPLGWMTMFPMHPAKNTLLGISSDGMDELQRWKQEKREKEMRKDAEAAAVATLPTPPEPTPPTITAHTPPTPPTNGQAPHFANADPRSTFWHQLLGAT